jgi:hypothetical protein
MLYVIKLQPPQDQSNQKSSFTLNTFDMRCVFYLPQSNTEIRRGRPNELSLRQTNSLFLPAKP